MNTDPLTSWIFTRNHPSCGIETTEQGESPVQEADPGGSSPPTDIRITALPSRVLQAYLRAPNGKRRYLQEVKSALATGQLTSFSEGKWFFSDFHSL